MYKPGRRSLSLACIAIVAACALLAVACSQDGDRPKEVVSGDRTRGPLAVVLIPESKGSSLVVVEPETGAVRRTIALRSLVTDISVDASSGLVVAAQSGGIGPEADDALSIIDPRTGLVRYVTLPVTDPGDVVCLGGRAFVMHSVIQQEGVVVSVVDIASATVVDTGHVPDGVGMWSAACGSIWTLAAAGDERTQLTRMLASLESSPTEAGPPAVFAVAEAQGILVLLGPGPVADGDGPGAGLVRLLDPATSAELAQTQATGLVRAPRQASTVGRRLVVGDWSGDEPEGRTLAVFDATTLEALGAIPVDGVPCAMGAWRDRLLVVDRLGGRLLTIDPASGRTICSAELGARDLVFSDVAVVE